MNQTMKLKNLRYQHCLFHLKNLQSCPLILLKSDLVRSKVTSGATGLSFILYRNYSTKISEPLSLEFLFPLSPPLGTSALTKMTSCSASRVLPLQTLS